MARKKAGPAADRPIKSVLLHLGYNMWCDRDYGGEGPKYTVSKPYMRFDMKLWRELTQRMADVGLNMVIIDLGEGIKYKSHPELAVRGSWSHDKLKRELDRLRSLGLEPIPKLNFSTCHDDWLGPYARMVSTDTYYAVCKDLIGEVAKLFGKPRLFHLGMDEETAGHHRHFAYCVLRQHELWWHDLHFLVDQAERSGARAWIWSDYVWNHPDLFYKNMPKSVLQSNWYYGDSFSQKINYVKTYVDLEKKRYDQVPTGSNWSNKVNFERTVRFCAKHIAAKRLLGFMHAPWHPTLMATREHHLEAVEEAGLAMAKWESKRKS